MASTAGVPQGVVKAPQSVPIPLLRSNLRRNGLWRRLALGCCGRQFKSSAQGLCPVRVALALYESLSCRPDPRSPTFLSLRLHCDRNKNDKYIRWDSLPFFFISLLLDIDTSPSSPNAQVDAAYSSSLALFTTHPNVNTFS